jgi:hypothetical protein
MPMTNDKGGDRMTTRVTKGLLMGNPLYNGFTVVLLNLPPKTNTKDYRRLALIKDGMTLREWREAMIKANLANDGYGHAASFLNDGHIKLTCEIIGQASIATLGPDEVWAYANLTTTAGMKTDVGFGVRAAEHLGGVGVGLILVKGPEDGIIDLIRDDNAGTHLHHDRHYRGGPVVKFSNNLIWPEQYRTGFTKLVAVPIERGFRLHLNQSNLIPVRPQKRPVRVSNRQVGHDERDRPSA